MDQRQLDYFLKVAERGSITAAAADLNITQPSLTKAMRLLEEELGVELVRRLPRGIDLTPAGVVLARHATMIRVQLQDAAAEVRALAKGDGGRVAIGAGPAWLRRLLPQAIAEVQAQRGGITVAVTGGFDETLFRHLRQGELDFVVAELPAAGAHPDLAQLALSRDAFVIAARPDHPLIDRPRLHLADLLAYPWVAPRGRTLARQRMEALFTMHNLPPPQPAVESDSHSFIVATLRHSDSLIYTTSSTAYAEGQAQLAFLDVVEPLGEREAGIIRRVGATLSPAAVLIVEALRRLCVADERN